MRDNELDLYVLCEYEFTLNSVNNLIRDGFTWDDFVNYTSKVEDLNIHKPALVSKILNTIPMVDEQKKINNLYQLSKAGLSLRNIKILIDYGFEYNDIRELTVEKLSSLTGGNKNSLHSKIKKAYDSIELLKGKSPLSEVEAYVEKLLDLLGPRETINRQSIEQKIQLEFKNLEIDIDIIEVFILKKLKAGLLIESENGLVKKYKKTKEFLNEEFRNKDLLLLRMSGASLQEIANNSGITRQAVAYKEARVLKHIDNLEEVLLYKGVFERFNWNQQLFCALYSEPIEVYQLLNLKFRKGNKSAINLLYEKNSFDDAQIKTILNHCESFVDYKGKIQPLSKTAIFEEILYSKKRDFITDTEMVEEFNNYLLEHNLDGKFRVDDMIVRGMSERSSIVIRTRSHNYRYYDYSNIDVIITRKLKELLDLNPGVYSMAKIFSENKDFMEEIDIRTEYELHNLYKRMFEIHGVTYNRMPEFSIGNIEKNKFLIRLFHEQAPIHIEEFCCYVEENYGLKLNSLRSHIQAFLSHYIHEDIIKVNYYEPNETELQRLKSIMVEDIYTVEQLNRLGEKIDLDFHDKFLNNMTLSKLGYTLKGKYVLSTQYTKIERYFTEHILSNNYFSRNGLEIYNSPSFNKALYDLEKNLDVIKIEGDVYITSKKLHEAEVSKLQLLDFREKALEMMGENQYFTLYSLRQRNFRHEIEDLGFEDFFYERIIWTSDIVRTIPLASGYIFIKKSAEVSLVDFIYYLVSEKRSINIYKMQEYVEKYYGISLDLYRVLMLVNNTDMYYSENLSKVFIDKNTYFEEIY